MELKLKSQLPEDMVDSAANSLLQYRYEKGLHQLVRALEGSRGMQRRRHVYDSARSAHYPRVRRKAFGRWVIFTRRIRSRTDADKKKQLAHRVGEYWKLQRIYVRIRNAAQKLVAQAFRRWERKLRRAQRREQEQAAIKLQAAARGFLARLVGTTDEGGGPTYQFSEVRLIQKMWRDRMQRNRARALLESRRRLRATVQLQKHGRAKFARRRVAAIISHRNSITIQKNWRANKQRGILTQKRRASMTMQRAWRGAISRRQALAREELFRQVDEMSEALENIANSFKFQAFDSIFARKQPVLSSVPCTLTADADMCVTSLRVSHLTDFLSGDVIIINPGGENEEISRVHDSRSVLLLETPLRHPHSLGETVQHQFFPHGEACHRTKQQRVMDVLSEQQLTAAQYRARLFQLSGKMAHAKQQITALAATADDPELIASSLQRVKDVFAVFVMQRDQLGACDRVMAANRLAIWFRRYLHRWHWRDVRVTVVDVVQTVVREESAALLQAFFRRTMLRRKMRLSAVRLHRERESAVRKIQRSYHEMKIRRMNFVQRQQYFAATHLQAVFRSYDSRQKTKKIYAMWSLAAEVRVWEYIYVCRLRVCTRMLCVCAYVRLFVCMLYLYLHI